MKHHDSHVENAIERAISRWKALRMIGVRVGETFSTLVAAIALETTRAGARPMLDAMAKYGLVARLANGDWRLEKR
jgi:hypothetical protein